MNSATTNSPDKETFAADFGSAMVSLVVDYDKIRSSRGLKKVLICEWSTKPTWEILPAYVQWMHTVMGRIAEKKKMKIIYSYPFKITGLSSFYLYHPDGTFEALT